MENKQIQTSLDKRNRICFGLGTVGRDMFYSMVSMYIMVFLTEVLGLDDAQLLVMTAFLTALRVFDAVNDPLMGLIVDNTRGRWGKFKPGILTGALAGAVLHILMFSGLGYHGPGTSVTLYAVIFAAVYLGWDFIFGLNDIAYWSMLPSLSTDQKERERIGSFARICASLGMFTVVVAIIPVTNALSTALGSARRGWLAMACVVCALMIGFQLITIIGVKEKRGQFQEEAKTTLSGMIRAIFKNDQLLWVSAAMALFMVGYSITTVFGVHYFKYIYGDAAMYSIFAAVLGVSQLAALSIFPHFTKKHTRKALYTLATCLVGAGYVVFFVSPANIVPIGIAALLLFVGQAFIQILMLMFLADSIEYGQWKLGRRNESITFSVQPFINKIGGALANGVLGVTLVLSGVNRAESAADVTAAGRLVFKSAMMFLPLAFIAAGYLIYLTKYKIDEKRFAGIVKDLKDRGAIREYR